MYSFTSARLVQAHLVWRCLFGIGCYTVHLLSLLGVFESCMDDLIRGFTPRTCCCATPMLRQHAAPPTRCPANTLHRERAAPRTRCPQHAVPRARDSASMLLRQHGSPRALGYAKCRPAGTLLRERAAPQRRPREHAAPQNLLLRQRAAT